MFLYVSVCVCACESVCVYVCVCVHVTNIHRSDVVYYYLLITSSDLCRNHGVQVVCVLQGTVHFMAFAVLATSKASRASNDRDVVECTHVCTVLTPQAI